MTDLNHITHMCVSVPNLDKLKRNLPIVLPHVDSVLIVIGKKDEEAVACLKSFPRVRVVYNPWNDSFRDQYQVGLNNIDGGWVNIMDDDELPSEGMLRSFRPLMEESLNGTKFDVVEFRAVEIREETGVGEPIDYYRQMFYKWSPQLRYEISLHQALVGLRRGARSEELYYHFKDALGNLKGGCRDFFTAGIWADHREGFEYWHEQTSQDPRINAGIPLDPQPGWHSYPLQDGFRIDAWDEMKDILARNHSEVVLYGDLDALIVSGGICQEFVDWAERHNTENDKRPHLHELYAFDEYIKLYREKRDGQSS